MQWIYMENKLYKTLKPPQSYLTTEELTVALENILMYTIPIEKQKSSHIIYVSIPRVHRVNLNKFKFISIFNFEDFCLCSIKVVVTSCNQLN